MEAQSQYLKISFESFSAISKSFNLVSIENLCIIYQFIYCIKCLISYKAYNYQIIMKSILCDENEDPVEELKLNNYFFSARMAELQNISQRVSCVDYEKLQTKKFETILNPTNPILTKYKSFLDLPSINNTKQETHTNTNVKPLPLSNKKKPVSKLKSKKTKDFIEENKSQLKSPAVSIQKSISNLSSPRNNSKKAKHVTIVEENQAAPQRLENTKYNPELLSLIFKQFTDLVLLQ